MADTKTSALTPRGTPDRANDQFAVINGGVNYRSTINNELGISGNPVGDTDSQTLSSKTLTSPTINGATLSGTLSGTYTLGGTPTFPSSVVTLTGSQTLTNKILTSPTINTPTITNASITQDSVVGFSTANTGTVYGVAITLGKLGSSTVNYTSLTTDSTWAYSTFSPAATGYSGSSTIIARYIQIGKSVVMDLYLSGTSNATTLTFTLPVAPRSGGAYMTYVTDSGTLQTSPGLLQMGAASTTATCYKTLGLGAWTNSGTKAVEVFGLVYEAN